MSNYQCAECGEKLQAGYACVCGSDMAELIEEDAPNMKSAIKSQTPTPSDIKAARYEAGLTQTQAAELVHSKLRTWQQWEAGDREMHPGLWELFCLKIAAS